jgi:hypothetical protein
VVIWIARGIVADVENLIARANAKGMLQSLVTNTNLRRMYVMHVYKNGFAQRIDITTVQNMQMLQ